MSEKIKFEHEMGAKVEDKVTGFQGTVTGAFTFINGCKRYAVEARVKDGESHTKPEELVFDEDRLQGIREAKTEIPKKPTGGPRPSPARAADPR